MDSLHGEAGIVARAYEEHAHMGWKKAKVPVLLEKGNGLWIGGRSKLELCFNSHLLT